jgi:hypothetical protein
LLAQPGANKSKVIVVELFPSSGRAIGAVRREACWDVRDARGRP